MFVDGVEEGDGLVERWFSDSWRKRSGQRELYAVRRRMDKAAKGVYVGRASLGTERGESPLRNWRWALLRHWSMASLFQGRVDTVVLPRSDVSAGSWQARDLTLPLHRLSYRDY